MARHANYGGLVTNSPQQIVLDVMAAIRSGDFDNLKPLLSDDVVYEDPRVTRRGLVGVRQVFEADSQLYLNFESDISLVTSEGRSVVVERVDHFTRDGQRYCLDVVSTFNINESGKVESLIQSFEAARPVGD